MSNFNDQNKTIQGLAQGSFSEIEFYYDRSTNCYGARKIIKGIKGEEDPKFEIFKDECNKVKAANCGSHPNILKYYEPKCDSERAWVDMEYIRGDTLERYLEKRNHFIDINEIYRLIREISDALAFCHVDIYKYRISPNEEGINPESLISDNGDNISLPSDVEEKLIKKYRIIHNDLHSSNIIRQSGTGRFFLFDFGISLNIMEDKKNGEIKSSMWAGAPAFMAPEKLEESEKLKSVQSSDIITPETDIYSFGVILYQMLSGELPCQNTRIAAWEFRNETPQEISAIRKRHFEESHPGETYVKDYPDWLEKLIMKCLEKNAHDRYHNAKELLEDFKKNYNEDSEEIKKEVDKLQEELEIRQIFTNTLKDKCLQTQIANKDLKKELFSLKQGLSSMDIKNKIEIPLREQLKLLVSLNKIDKTKKLYKRLSFWTAILSLMNVIIITISFAKLQIIELDAIYRIAYVGVFALYLFWIMIYLINTTDKTCKIYNKVYFGHLLLFSLCSIVALCIFIFVFYSMLQLWLIVLMLSSAILLLLTILSTLYCIFFLAIFSQNILNIQSIQKLVCTKEIKIPWIICYG